jgi:hypothetical protein
MSYLKQLQEHYKAVRARIQANALPEEKAPLRLTHDLSEPEQKPEKPPRAGLSPEGADANLVTEALRQANPEWIGGNHSQAIKIAQEMVGAPKLPPLPGLNLNETGAVRWMRILHAVAAHHDVCVNEIMSASRKKHIINARFEVFYRLRVDLNFSYTKIASLMKRDHTTVLHGVHKVKESLLDVLSRTHDDDGSFAVNHLTASGTHSGQSVASP